MKILSQLAERALKGDFEAPDAAYQRFATSREMLSTLVHNGSNIGTVCLSCLQDGIAADINHGDRTLRHLAPSHIIALDAVGWNDTTLRPFDLLLLQAHWMPEGGLFQRVVAAAQRLVRRFGLVCGSIGHSSTAESSGQATEACAAWVVHALRHDADANRSTLKLVGVSEDTTCGFCLLKTDPTTVADAANMTEEVMHLQTIIRNGDDASDEKLAARETTAGGVGGQLGASSSSQSAPPAGADGTGANVSGVGIRILSYSDRPSLYNITFPRLRQYAQQHGYSHTLVTDLDAIYAGNFRSRMAGRHASWTKVLMLIDELRGALRAQPAPGPTGSTMDTPADTTRDNQYRHHHQQGLRYLWWVDDDVYVTNGAVTLESFIHRYGFGPADRQALAIDTERHLSPSPQTRPQQRHRRKLIMGVKD